MFLIKQNNIKIILGSFLIIPLIIFSCKSSKHDERIPSSQRTKILSTLKIKVVCSDQVIGDKSLIVLNRSQLCKLFAKELKLNQGIILSYQGNFNGNVFEKYSGWYYLTDSEGNKIDRLKQIEIGNYGFVEKKNISILKSSRKYNLSQIEIKSNPKDSTNINYEQITIFIHPR
jgi:hypothetical protein